jgi:hypothetical protein
LPDLGHPAPVPGRLILHLSGEGSDRSEPHRKATALDRLRNLGFCRFRIQDRDNVIIEGLHLADKCRPADVVHIYDKGTLCTFRFQGGVACSRFRLFVITVFQIDFELESAPGTLDAIDVDPAVHQFDDRFADRETQAGSAELAGR